MVQRACDKLFGQYHLVDGAALHDSLNKEVTGQFHLAEHAHLRISGLPMLGTGLGKRGGIVQGIGRAPHNAIDGEQLQPAPAGVIGLLVPACSGVVKQPLNALVAKRLAALSVPTCIVQGADTRALFALVGEALAAQTPIASCNNLRGANHLYPIKQPAAFASAVQSWLAGQASANQAAAS